MGFRERFGEFAESKAAIAIAGALVVALGGINTALALRSPQPTAVESSLASEQPAAAWASGASVIASDAHEVFAFSAFASKQAALKPDYGLARPPIAQSVPSPFQEILGSVSAEIGSSRVLSRWIKILTEAADTSVLRDCRHAEICQHPMLVDLRRKLKHLHGVSKMEAIAAVHSLVNRSFRYSADSLVYGVADHWASLGEFVEKGAGDCEDFAIAKMWLLASLGIPRTEMRLVVLRDTISRVDHAVLAIAHEGKNLILDNRQAVVRADSEMKHYRPYYSLSADGKAWVHALPVRPQAVAGISTTH
jgi:predicted transglutaminase-like cysteine proteinase